MALVRALQGPPPGTVWQTHMHTHRCVGLPHHLQGSFYLFTSVVPAMTGILQLRTIRHAAFFQRRLHGNVLHRSFVVSMWTNTVFFSVWHRHSTNYVLANKLRHHGKLWAECEKSARQKHSWGRQKPKQWKEEEIHLFSKRKVHKASIVYCCVHVHMLAVAETSWLCYAKWTR